MIKLSEILPIAFILSLIALIAPFTLTGPVNGHNVEVAIIVLNILFLAFSILGSICTAKLLESNPDNIKDSTVKAALTRCWHTPISKLTKFVLILSMVLQGQYILMVFFIIILLVAIVLADSCKSGLKKLAEERGISSK